MVNMMYMRDRIKEMKQSKQEEAAPFEQQGGLPSVEVSEEFWVSLQEYRERRKQEEEKISNFNILPLRNVTEDGVNWCCDQLLRSSGLTTVTVRAGEGESSNLWLFTLEYRTANYRYARSYSALRAGWESQKDFDLFYKELQAMAREIVETATNEGGK